MSTSDWPSDDLADIGGICLRIHEYRDDASEDLKPLLDKFGSLGRQLNSLSEVLQTSGRSGLYYHDPELETHVHNAKTDLERHFGVTDSAGSLSHRFWRNRLRKHRIKELHHYVDEHHAKAKDFKTEILLLTAHDKLEFLREKVLQNRNNSGVPGAAVDVGTVLDESDSITDEVQAVPGSLGNPRTEDDTASVLTEVTGAFQLARIVWAGRANRYRPRWRPGASSSSKAPDIPTNDGGSVREEFVHDVVEVIKETRLYAEDTLPQEVLDKLSGIVSKAVRLGNTLTSPEISAQQNNTLPAPKMSARNIRDPHDKLRGLPWDFGDRSSRIRPEPLSLGEPAMSTSGSSASVVASSDSRSEGVFALRSHTAEEELDSIRDRRLLHQEGWQGWVKISCPQIGLPPTPCSLEITESAGSICVDAVTTPTRVAAGSIKGSVQSERTGASSTTSESMPSGNGNVAYLRAFKHLFPPDARPIPSVWHPRYEGPSVAPDEPYTITFTRKQIFREGGVNEPLLQVADLKYSFSDKDYRDCVRSLLFGKQLLASTGVKKVSFNNIASERQAVSLWFDKHSNRKTVTFPQISRDGGNRRHLEVEYEVGGIEENSAEGNEQPLVLFLTLVLNAETPTRPPHRASTILSVISRQSTASTLLGDRDRCSLFFSEIPGKVEFVEALGGR